MVSLPIALQHAAHCVSAETVAIMLESALEKRALTVQQVADILEMLPERVRRRIGRVSPLAGSGSETRVRRYLQAKGVTVREQVHIQGVGRVDLLVGEKLIIECDSSAHHDTVTGYHTDRHRDLQAHLQGYRVLRLTWEQVWLRWDETKAALDALIRGRIHRAPRSQPRVGVSLSALRKAG